ncbi:MAG: hypothetical protein D6704_08650, partial [Nitrospirae bacterium]
MIVLVMAGAPIPAAASPCHQFPWPDPEPPGLYAETFQAARTALENGLRDEAERWFRIFLQKYPQGPAAEAAKFAMATFVTETHDSEGAFLDVIARLRALRQRYPDSPYAPWALCQIGEFYRQGGWYQEAKGAFEQFLTAYPDHPLTPAVLIGAGRNFLDSRHHLEAALVFRRILDEPAWHTFYPDAALGLADSAAAAQAWDQAQYWYDAVSLERPELIRSSARSLYLRGLTALAHDQIPQAMEQFLMAFNLHPHADATGHAMNRLSELLLTRGAEVPALWFADQAIKRFPDRIQGRTGRMLVLRWAIQDLANRKESREADDIRPRLAELGIAVPLSWH